MDSTKRQRLKQIIMIALLIIMIAAMATVALADVKSSVSGAVSGVKGSLGKIFNFDADNPGFMDFAIFFLIFMSLSWLGFSKWFENQQGSGKAAVIGLSVGIAIAFSAALVYGGKFGIGKLLPFAIVFIVIAMFILLYVLMEKMLKADTVGKKILAAIIALIITLILVIFGVGYLAEKGVCEKNSFMKKVCGSESILNKIGDGKGVGGTADTSKPSITPPTGKITNTTKPGDTTKKTDEIPERIQQQLDAIEKRLKDTESRLNEAIKDDELEGIVGAKYRLDDIHTELTTIIAVLARE